MKKMRTGYYIDLSGDIAIRTYEVWHIMMGMDPEDWSSRWGHWFVEPHESRDAQAFYDEWEYLGPL